jgi:hypothetical protein
MLRAGLEPGPIRDALASLRVEHLFPADEATRRAMEEAR